MPYPVAACRGKGGAPALPSPLLNQLAAYYKLDETTGARADATGRGNTLTDGSGTTGFVAGAQGNAAKFLSSQSDYLYRDDCPDLSVANIDFTLACTVWLTTKASNQEIIAKYTSATNNREYILQYNLAQDKFSFTVSSNGTALQAHYATTLGSPATGQWYAIRAWHDSVNNQLGLQVDAGAQDTLAYATGVFNGNSPFALGSLRAAAPHYADIYLDKVGVWKRLLTAGEWNVYRASGHPFTWLDTGVVVFDGNSMTDPATSTYPAECMTTLRSTRDWLSYNFGVSGQQTPAMTADAATQIDPLINTYAARNIVVPWEITNNLKLGTNAATAYANYVTYCQARQAAGWKVVAVTVLPRSDAGTPGDFEASRQTVNTNIRNNWGTFADALADVAANPDMGDAGDETDATYYADLAHPTEAGYAIVAGIVAAAVNTL